MAAPDLALRPPSLFEQRDRQVRHALVSLQTPESRTLESRRELDRLRWLSGSSGNAYPGAGIFGAVVIAAAHAPGPLRLVFDRPWHLGPALLDGGGLGVGLGGRW